jgi:HNH endonuclease
VTAVARPASRRGTSNGNVRGGSPERRRRREWLVQTYRANQDVVEMPFPLPYALHTDLGQGVPACRCYRCGQLLTVDTVTVDRIVPGCQGGTYRRDNIRPCCGPCNSETGGSTRGKR